jgi:hypothetical protein
MDEEFSIINSIVNEIYSSIEKTDNKEDYPFSIIKLGMTIWRYRVFKKISKALFKASKGLLK